MSAIGTTPARYALFGSPDAAQEAVNNLRRAGVTDVDITVISSEPHEEYEFSHRDKPTWIFWLAGLGGLIGLSAGYLLTSMTERAWPLVTGGMPIVSTWPNLIVMFEMTMLGAIVTTVVALLMTAGLLRRRPRLYDPEISNGRILVGVEQPRTVSIEQLDRALEAAGGRVKVIA